MKEIVVMLVLLASHVGATGISIVNGGFELYDYKWTYSLTGVMRVYDSYGNEVENPPFTMQDIAGELYGFCTPTGISECSVYFPWSGATNMTPVDGDSSLVMSGWNVNNFPFEDYIIVAQYEVSSMTREVHLEAGDVVSGWSAFETYEKDPTYADSAWVDIQMGSVSTRVWECRIEDVLAPMYQSMYSSGWQYWEWTAPVAGMYALSLNTSGDDLIWSFGHFDAISITHSNVTEPCGLMLMGLGVIALLGTRRRKN